MSKRPDAAALVAPVDLTFADEADLLPEEPQFSLLLLSDHPRKWREQYLIACTYRDAADHRCWVARVAGRAVAACGSVESDTRVELRFLGVQRGFQRRGIGQALVRFVVDQAGDRAVEAVVDAEAVSFYRHLGFEIEPHGLRYPAIEQFLCRRMPG